MNSPPRTRRGVWGIYLAAVAVYFVAVVHRTALGVAGVEALERFHVQATGLAFLSVTQIATYAVMQIPSGHLLDRFGPRTMMTVGSLVMAAGQLLLALNDHFALAIAARVLIGAGDAPIFISAARLIAHWFPARRVPVLMQVTGLIGQAGQLATAIPVAWLLHAQGWTADLRHARGGWASWPRRVAATWVRDATLLRPGSGTRGARPLVGVDPRRHRARWHPTSDSGATSCRRSPRTSSRCCGACRSSSPRKGSAPRRRAPCSSCSRCPRWSPARSRACSRARHPLRRTWIVLGSADRDGVAWIVLLSFDTPRPWWQLALFCAVIGTGGPISLVGMDFARSLRPG